MQIYGYLKENAAFDLKWRLVATMLYVEMFQYAFCGFAENKG